MVNGEWLIGARAHNISYVSTVTTQHRSRQRCVRCLLMKARHVLMIDKAWRHAGAYQWWVRPVGTQFSRLVIMELHLLSLSTLTWVFLVLLFDITYTYTHTHNRNSDRKTDTYINIYSRHLLRAPGNYIECW